MIANKTKTEPILWWGTFLYVETLCDATRRLTPAAEIWPCDLQDSNHYRRTGLSGTRLSNMLASADLYQGKWKFKTHYDEIGGDFLWPPDSAIKWNKIHKCDTRYMNIARHRSLGITDFIKIHILNDKQCRSRSVGFFRSQLIWICTVCKGRVYPGSAGQGLIQDYAGEEISQDKWWRCSKCLFQYYKSK